MISNVLFFIFAILTVFSALMVISRRNPVSSGVWLLGTFVSIAAIYILLNAQFIAIIQITIYAGAILVLVLFVIMLLNLREAGHSFTDLVFNTRQGIAVLVFAGLFVLEMITILILRYYPVNSGLGTYSNAKIASDGAIQSLSEVLFTKYLLPFEVASVTLLVAIIGAVVLTRKNVGARDNARKGGEET